MRVFKDIVTVLSSETPGAGVVIKYQPLGSTPQVLMHFSTHEKVWDTIFLQTVGKWLEVWDTIFLQTINV